MMANDILEVDEKIRDEIDPQLEEIKHEKIRIQAELISKVKEL